MEFGAPQKSRHRNQIRRAKFHGLDGGNPQIERLGLRDDRK